MMYTLLCIGALVAIVNLMLTYVELLPFIKAVSQLNKFTKSKSNPYDWFLYPFRFCSILPKAFCLAIDVGIAVVCGSIGLNSGVFGALIGLSLGFTASLLVKAHRYCHRNDSMIVESWKS